MNPLDLLFGQIKNTITNHASPNTPGPVYDPTDLLGQLSGIFGQTSQQHGMPWGGGQEYDQGQNQVLPASQDPYGDPADGSYAQTAYGGQGVLPASQDPYGDPADQPNNRGRGEIAPASQDPYGDPADYGR